MKYVRTMNGISQFEEEIIECVIKPNGIHFKQADTIEELCDEFVIKMDDEYITKRTMLELIDMNNYVQAIYGAIWTDKGLIYVAKMNEKGELELL